MWGDTMNYWLMKMRDILEFAGTTTANVPTLPVPLGGRMPRTPSKPGEIEVELTTCPKCGAKTEKWRTRCHKCGALLSPS